MAPTATVKEPTEEKIAIAQGVMPHEFSFIEDERGPLLESKPPRYVVIGSHYSPQISTGRFDGLDPAPRKSQVIVPVDQFPTNLRYILRDVQKIIDKRYADSIKGTVIELYAFEGDIPPGNDEKERMIQDRFFQDRPNLVQLVDIVHRLPPVHPRWGQHNPPSHSSARFTGIQQSGADFRAYFHKTTDVAQLQGRVLEVRVNGTAEYQQFLFPEPTPTPDQ